MKAAVIERQGGLENLVYRDWPDPVPGRGEVLVRVRGCGLNHLGVIITDSITTPLCWGVTGATIAHSGFLALNNFVGHPDIFGRALNMTKVNIANALAAAAVLVMGEADEQTPLAVLSDLPFVQFQAGDPTPAELHGLHIALEDDLYAPLLKSVPWQTGRKGAQA